MPTKQEAIESIVNHQNYVGSYVKKIISEIDDLGIKGKPSVIRKHDVIKITSQKKYRPGVVIKVTKEYVIAIPLTSSENVHCMSESKSRFFKDGCFTNGYEVVPIDLAFENWIGIYGNAKLVNNAIKELRQFISKNI